MPKEPSLFPETMNLHRIDNLCDDFEDALRRGEPVRIEDFVELVTEDQRPKLLRELLEIEIEFTDARNPEDDPGGEPPIFRLQASLKERFPEQSELVDSVVRRIAKLRQIGDYVILEELGHGGMGIVYKARQKLLNQVVAIKVLSQKLLDDPQAVGRFRREMQLIGGLNHPNIVRAMNAGTVHPDSGDGMHYLAMEFVDGVTLQRLCDTLRKDEAKRPEPEYAPTVRHDSVDRSEAKKSEPGKSTTALCNEPAIPLAAACEVIRQAALGLEHAHQFGLVHRDIKPANLMLDRSGTVKLLDLGLGKFLAERRLSDDEASLTMDGTTIGTIDYISPEQCENAANADIRADIYSLGCTFYFLVTGRAPYSGSRYDTTRKKLMAHIVGEVPKLNKVLPDVSPELEAIVEKMLAKEPEERFQTPLEVAEALVPFASFEELYELTGSTSEGVYSARPGSTSRMLGTSDTRQTKAVLKPKFEYVEKLKTFSKVLWGVAFLVAIVSLGTTIALRHFFLSTDVSNQQAANEKSTFVDKSALESQTLKMQVEADMALLPGLYGGWWAEETPWYLPFVRESFLTAMDEADGDAWKSVLGGEAEKYFETNIPAVQSWLWTVTQKRLEVLPEPKRKLVEKLREFYVTNSGAMDDDKMFEEFLNILSAEKPTDTPWSAAELHSRAVLEHRLAVLRNDRELAGKASQHYAEALTCYRREIRAAEEAKKISEAKRLGLLDLLCRSDAARLEYLATGSYQKAIDKYEEVRAQLRTFEYRSPLFQAELQAAFGALCAESGQYQDSVFTWGLESLKRTRLGKGLHPLAAQLAERYAWSLIDQWKVVEAEKQFREALFIRAANQKESGDRFATIYVWHDWHALALTLRYLGNSQQAIDEYRKTLESIDKELEACRTEMKSKDPTSGSGLRHYCAKVRDRAANTRERLADCTLYGGAASGVSQARLREIARLYGEAAELYDIEGVSRTMKAKQAVALLLSNDIADAEKILRDLDEQKRQLLGNQVRSDLVRQVADALLVYKKTEGEPKPASAKNAIYQFLEQFSIPSNPVFKDATRRENLELRMLCAEFLVAEAFEGGDMQALAKDLSWLVQPMGFFLERPESRPFLMRINETTVRSYALLYEKQPPESPLRQTFLRNIVRLLEWMRLQGPSETAASALVVFFLTGDAKDGFVLFYPLDVTRKGEFYRLPITRQDVKGGSNRQTEKWRLDEKLLQAVENERKEGRHVTISWSDQPCWRRAEDALTDADWPFEEFNLKNE